MQSVSKWAWLGPVFATTLGCTTLLGLDQDYKTSESGGTGGDTTTSASGGTSSGGAANGGAGAGGAGSGGSAPCTVPEECPLGANSCLVPVCDAGICGTAPAPEGTPSDQQTAGDCAVVVCNGTGSITITADPGDVPPAADECHTGSCDGGPPHQVPATAGTGCSVGGTLCDGAGNCVECSTNEQCPGGVCAANFCVSAACGDGVTNGSETDTDCGGDCGPNCDLGQVCVGGQDCLTGYCADGTCATLPLGIACDSNSSCSSGFCASGVCCSSECLGGCNSCAQAGSEGTCAPLPAGSDGRCPGSVCTGNGDCGVCSPGDYAGECCLNCDQARGPQKKAKNLVPPSPPDCCTMILCGFDGLPPTCL